MLYDGCTAGGGGGGIPAPGTVPGGAIGTADEDDDDDEAPPFHISNSTTESKSPDEGVQDRCFLVLGFGSRSD